LLRWRPLLLLRLFWLLRALDLVALPPVLALRPAGRSAGWARRPPPLALARSPPAEARLFCADTGRPSASLLAWLRDAAVRVWPAEAEPREAAAGRLAAGRDAVGWSSPPPLSDFFALARLDAARSVWRCAERALLAVLVPLAARPRLPLLPAEALDDVPVDLVMACPSSGMHPP
jgi:hypothetical protein